MDKPEGAFKVELGKLDVNTPHDKILANVMLNCKRQIPQLQWYGQKSEACVIACGGPSLRANFLELRDLHFQRKPIFAVNGAANWLVSQNIRPAAVVIMDAQPHNVGFVQEPIIGCKYFLASQCDPGLFDACKGRDVTIFHALSLGEDSEETAFLDNYYGEKRWSHVVGASTVGTRAIWLAKMLGYELQHVFGLDSCVMETGHHAYAQEWQDNEQVHNIWCGGRHFKCTGWHIAQAEGFKDFVKAAGERFSLNVHGDGLLAHMVRSGKDLEKRG